MTDKDDKDRLSRREFLVRLVKTSAVAGGTLVAGGYFLDRHIAAPQRTAGPIRSFAVPDAGGLFAVARGGNPYEITRKAVASAGGMKRFISRGDKVLIKVNCAFARPAWVGATTSPQVTTEVVRLCYEAGASDVAVAENAVSDTKTSFTRSGLYEAVEKAGGRILLPGPSDFRRIHVNDGTIGTWEIFDPPLRWCDKLIGIPTLKTHFLCGSSLAMKNWYGFFGGSRSRLHQDIHRVIVELGQFITPSLVVLDATRKLVRNGPTGGSAADVTAGDTVAVSTDQVAVDAFGTELLGLKLSDAPYIAMAQEAGLGTADYRRLPGSPSSRPKLRKIESHGHPASR